MERSYIQIIREDVFPSLFLPFIEGFSFSSSYPTFRRLHLDWLPERVGKAEVTIISAV
jgi:hypothetical protein